MKYSEQTYEKALDALTKLRDTVSDSEKFTIDFVVEAIAEKKERDNNSEDNAPNGKVKTGISSFIESIYQGIWLGLPLYPWFSDKTKQVYSRNVFREMKNYGVSWIKFQTMLDRANNLRNEFIGHDLLNRKMFLIRENKRFIFSLRRNYILSKWLNDGTFHVWDDNDCFLGEFKIPDME